LNVLVTGGFGSIGAWVTRRIVELGLRPVVFSPRRTLGFLTDIANELDFAPGDVSDLPQLLHAVKQYHINRIVHLAALIVPDSQANPPRAVDVNVGGTLNVFEAARLFDIERVVFTSTKGIFGSFTGEHAFPTYKPVQEDHPPRPNLVYESTKLLCEQLAANYRRQWGVNTIVLRFCQLYGPGRVTRHGHVAIQSRLVENAMAGQASRVAKGGDERDDLLYVRDVAHAIVLAATVDGLRDNVFNVSSGRGETLSEFAGAVRTVLPGADVDVGPGLDYFGVGINYYCIFDTTRAREQLGFKPQYDLVEGVRDYVQSMRRFGIEPTVSYDQRVQPAVATAIGR
jgi:UDP-glucose 4-epimerase